MLAALLALALVFSLAGTAGVSVDVSQAAKKKNPCAKYKKGSKKRKACDKKRTSCTRYKKGSKKRKQCVVNRRKKAKRPGKPGTPAPPKSVDLTPPDYGKVEGVSQVRYKADEIEQVSLRMPSFDGAGIYLEITKPKGVTNLPVILESSPYHGTIADREGTRILPLPLDKEKKPIGLTGYFAPRGYAVAMMDLRGTGRSEGCLDHLGPNDHKDLKAVVEYLAMQPWSNGRVGMTGHSYVGSTTQAATKLNPKGLVTTVPSAGLARMYDHQFHTGVAWNLQYVGPMAAYPSLATSADLPPGLPTGGAPVGGPTGDNFNQGARPQDALCEYENTALNNGPGNATGQETQWHKDRDASKEATAWQGHVFLVHGVNDNAARIPAAQWFFDRGLRKGDKLWLGQWDHGSGCCPNQRGMQWTHALHAWFDRQLMLKEVNTGPPVEVFLNDEATVDNAVPKRKEIYTSETYPAAAKTLTYGTNDGELLEGKEGEPSAMTYVADPRGYQGQETGNVEMVSKPLDRELLLAGLPKLELHVSTTGTRSDLIANIIDRNEKGEDRRMSACAMTPLLRDGLDTVTPIVPGEVMKLEPSCWAMGHKLRKGHRLVLRVASSDGEYVPLGAAGTVSVQVGADATKLTLPVVEGKLYPDTMPVGARPAGDTGD